MMQVLLLRLDAPLLSFGSTSVDARNITDDFPARSMVTGLCANALGYDHRDVALLQRLQTRLSVGARRDRTGERLVDYQTVDLGQAFLAAGWTTAGRLEGREGGDAATGTHIRFRHYLADAVYTVALTLHPPNETPTLEELERAFKEPSRPLFIGRKCCLPSEPLALGLVEANSLLSALTRAPLSKRAKAGRMLVRVPAALRDGMSGSEQAVTEERDWANQIHVGRQRVVEALVDVVGDGGTP